MRRILLSAFSAVLFVTSVSCKEEKKEDDTTPDNSNNVEIENQVTDCEKDSVFEAYRNAVLAGNGPQWINENGSLLCNGELTTCVEYSHRIKDANNFNIYVNNHQANAGGAVYYPVKWQEIENKLAGIECYENYLMFSIAGNKLVMQQGPFSGTYTTYSAVFLRQVRRQHNLGPNDTISFVLAKVPLGSSQNTKESVIFKIDKSTLNPYYDLSDYPGVTGEFTAINPS